MWRAASVEERGCWALRGNYLLKRLIRPFISYLIAPQRVWQVRSESVTRVAPSPPSPPSIPTPCPHPLVRAPPLPPCRGAAAALWGEAPRARVGALGVRLGSRLKAGGQHGHDCGRRWQGLSTGPRGSSPQGGALSPGTQPCTRAGVRALSATDARACVRATWLHVHLLALGWGSWVPPQPSRSLLRGAFIGHHAMAPAPAAHVPLVPSGVTPPAQPPRIRRGPWGAAHPPPPAACG